MTEFSGSTFDEVDAGWASPNRSWQAVNQTRVPSFWCPSNTIPKTWSHPASASTQALGAPATIEVQISDDAAYSGSVYQGGTLMYHPTATNAAGNLRWVQIGNIADNGFMGVRWRENIGAPWPGRPTRFASLLHGASNTIAVGEQGALHQNRNDYRASAVGNGMWTCKLGTHYADNSNVVFTLFPINYQGAEWRAESSVGWPGGAYTRNQYQYSWGNTTFRSTHPGGAMFTFGDGSVHFMTDNIQFETYTALMDRADSSPINAEAF